MMQTSRCLAAWSFACAISASFVAAAQTAPSPPSDGSAPPIAMPPPASMPASATPPAISSAPEGPAPPPAVPSAPVTPWPAWGRPSPYAPPPGYWPRYPVLAPPPAYRAPHAGTGRRPPSRAQIGMIAGAAGFGAGWVASMVSAIFQEIAGVSCGIGYWGIPGCSDDGVDRISLLIPVAGPFMQLHERGVGDGEKATAAVLGSLQLLGVATFAIALGTELHEKGTPSPSARSAVTLRLSPLVGPGGGTLGVTGTF